MLELQYPSPTLRKLKLHAQISSPASLVPLRPPICRGRNQHSWTIVFGTYLEVKMPEDWDQDLAVLREKTCLPKAWPFRMRVHPVLSQT
jgi:hypothetical protein